MGGSLVRRPVRLSAIVRAALFDCPVGERMRLMFYFLPDEAVLAGGYSWPKTSSRDCARAPEGSAAGVAVRAASVGGSPARCAGGRSWRAAPPPPSGAPPSPAGATTGPATSRARARVAVPNGASRLPSAVAHIALSP